MRRVVVVAVCVAALVAPAVPAAAGRPPVLDPIVSSARAYVGHSAQSLGFEMGRIEIPAIGMDEVIREGIDINVINRGVAHWAGTAQPGDPSNMVLAGHRTTWSYPFLDLNLLDPGDEIHVTGIDGRQVTYRVSRTLIVDPEDVWIANPTVTPTLTLFACHPKFSARHRIVVRADLVGEPDPLAFP